MGYTKSSRWLMTMPRVPQPTPLPFDLIEGRLVRLMVPYAMLVEMRAEWDAANNEDRAWLAEELGKITDDDLRTQFAEYRANGA